jgi:hypothetical protein
MAVIPFHKVDVPPKKLAAQHGRKSNTVEAEAMDMTYRVIVLFDKCQSRYGSSHLRVMGPELMLFRLSECTCPSSLAYTHFVDV